MSAFGFFGIIVLLIIVVAAVKAIFPPEGPTP
jgi:hypothetical protein